MGCLKLPYRQEEGLEKSTLFFSKGLREKSAPGKKCDDYYPFGGRFNSYQRSFSQPNKYLYNGKEIQEETDWYDFGARMQDPWLGRFMTQDRFSEKYYDLTPYHYAANNPIYYIDVNGDSLNVAQLREFSSDASSALVSDLQAKSGLTLTADANGNVSYAKNSKGKAVVTKVNGKKSGSRAARKALTKLIDSETTVSVAGSNTLSTRVDMDGPDPNLIIFNPGQTQDAINNTSGDLNSTTNGWALTFFHEIGHTEYGGTGYDPSTGPANGPAKQQDPFTTAGRQEILPNRIRRQLGRDYGQRVIYNSIPVSSAGQNYFPWSQKSLRQLKAGIVPTQKFIIHPWGSK